MLDKKDVHAVEVLCKDFSKAFDLLQPSKLAETLQDISVTPDILRLSLNFMSRKQQCVRIKSATSDYIPIHVEVPQGTLSGPMFWLAFLSIPTVFHQLTV
jgi:hypothetical protein